MALSLDHWLKRRKTSMVFSPTNPSLEVLNLLIVAIKGLDVESLAADDRVLRLWTTNAYLRVSFDVLDAWGFECKNVLAWVEDRFGLGAWLRNQRRSTRWSRRTHTRRRARAIAQTVAALLLIVPAVALVAFLPGIPVAARAATRIRWTLGVLRWPL